MGLGALVWQLGLHGHHVPNAGVLLPIGLIAIIYFFNGATFYFAGVGIKSHYPCRPPFGGGKNETRVVLVDAHIRR